MIEFTQSVTSTLGFHARPIASFVSAARQWQSAVTLFCNERSADGNDLMGLMQLDVSCGDEVHVRVEGTDEDEAAAALQELLEVLLTS